MRWLLVKGGFQPGLVTLEFLMAIVQNSPEFFDCELDFHRRSFELLSNFSKGGPDNFRGAGVIAPTDPPVVAPKTPNHRKSFTTVPGGPKQHQPGWGQIFAVV